jgi:hypothetical protein
MNFVHSGWKLNDGFGTANCDSPYQSLESQESLGISAVAIPPWFDDIFFKSVLIGIRMNSQKFDNAGEICEFVLNGSSSDRPSSGGTESATRLGELALRVLDGMGYSCQ